MEANITSFLGKTVQVVYHLDSDGTGQFAGFSVDDFSVITLPPAPTAAGVTVSGQVRIAYGRVVPRANVSLIAPNGEVKVATTNAFGYYNFADVGAGETYVFKVSHKKYEFVPRAVSVVEEISDLNFTASR